MDKTYFVTGTDTDAGKTVAAKALLDHLNHHGLSTLAMKPVASGCRWQQQRWVNDDAQALRAAMSLSCPYELSNPFAFEPAIAPHIAARQAATDITLAALMNTVSDLRALQPQALVIEGAGGWELPLAEDLSMPAFVKACDAEVVLVVGLKLGCLNHAALSERAILADGLKLAGWIAVDTGPQAMPYRAENVATLSKRLKSPCLAELPFVASWQHQDLSSYVSGLL